MLLKEATLCKIRVVLHNYGLRLSSFPHPKATLRVGVQRKVTNLLFTAYRGDYAMSRTSLSRRTHCGVCLCLPSVCSDQNVLCALCGCGEADKLCIYQPCGLVSFDLPTYIAVWSYGHAPRQTLTPAQSPNDVQRHLLCPSLQ